MKKKINDLLLKMQTGENCIGETANELCSLFNVSSKECSDIDRLYRLSINTPYPVDDIIEFMMLTGIKADRIEETVQRFAKCGVSNLTDVNTLVKMGHFNCY